jgi:hypothetical protein
MQMMQTVAVTVIMIMSEGSYGTLEVEKDFNICDQAHRLPSTLYSERLCLKASSIVRVAAH